MNNKSDITLLKPSDRQKLSSINRFYLNTKHAKPWYIPRVGSRHLSLRSTSVLVVPKRLIRNIRYFDSLVPSMQCITVDGNQVWFDLICNTRVMKGGLMDSTTHVVLMEARLVYKDFFQFGYKSLLLILKILLINLKRFYQFNYILWITYTQNIKCYWKTLHRLYIIYNVQRFYPFCKLTPFYFSLKWPIHTNRCFVLNRVCRSLYLFLIKELVKGYVSLKLQPLFIIVYTSGYRKVIILTKELTRQQSGQRFMLYCTPGDIFIYVQCSILKSNFNFKNCCWKDQFRPCKWIVLHNIALMLESIRKMIYLFPSSDSFCLIAPYVIWSFTSRNTILTLNNINCRNHSNEHRHVSDADVLPRTETMYIING